MALPICSPTSTPRPRRGRRRGKKFPWFPVLTLAMGALTFAWVFWGPKAVEAVKKKAQAVKETKKPKTKWEKLGVYKYANLSSDNYKNAYQTWYGMGHAQGSRCKLLMKQVKENNAWVLFDGIKDHHAQLQKQLDDLVDTFQRQLAQKASESSLKETGEAIEVALGTLRGYEKGVFDGCDVPLW